MSQSASFLTSKKTEAGSTGTPQTRGTTGFIYFQNIIEQTNEYAFYVCGSGTTCTEPTMEQVKGPDTLFVKAAAKGLVCVRLSDRRTALMERRVTEQGHVQPSWECPWLLRTSLTDHSVGQDLRLNHKCKLFSMLLSDEYEHSGKVVNARVFSLCFPFVRLKDF